MGMENLKMGVILAILHGNGKFGFDFFLNFVHYWLFLIHNFPFKDSFFASLYHRETRIGTKEKE